MNVVTEHSPETESARKVCAHLYRSCCDLRLYPASHPTFRASMEALLEALDDHQASIGSLVLEVGEAVLRCEDEEVYSQNSGRDNLAFIMFRDGIRTLTSMRGRARGAGGLCRLPFAADQLAETITT